MRASTDYSLASLKSDRRKIPACYSGRKKGAHKTPLHITPYTCVSKYLKQVSMNIFPACYTILYVKKVMRDNRSRLNRDKAIETLDEEDMLYQKNLKIGHPTTTKYIFHNGWGILSKIRVLTNSLTNVKGLKSICRTQP